MEGVLLGKGKSIWKGLEVRHAVHWAKSREARVAGMGWGGGEVPSAGRPMWLEQGRGGGEVPEVRGTDRIEPCRSLGGPGLLNGAR